MASVGTPKTPRAIASSVLRLIGDARFRFPEVQLRHELRPFDRHVAEAAVAPHKAKDAAYRLGCAIGHDREAQERQRIERMRRRKFERDPQGPSLPDDVAIGETALARNLRRPLVSVRAEQRGEQDRPKTNAQRALELRQQLALQIPEG